TILGTDTHGLNFARRSSPGFLVGNGYSQHDPWIRLDGRAMFRSATELFAALIRESAARSGWELDKTDWVIPHQANLRILKAAAKRSGIPYERFCVNIEKVGNTSSASIPLALADIEDRLKPGDKMILCSVGAGVTTAAVSVEW
ncbi:MAG: 3-oxoacyl-ACP synthase, partial [Candidatus Sumerlaeota bacterium]|nr:3-oxoacyl-ACP synthase [Candidatus Sumerlaeota bacterium]